jgi:FkbM family methyltransferase
MMTKFLKRVATFFPFSWQHEMRRIFFHRQIRRRSFFTDEKEYALLNTFLRDGDWVIDLGANVGHYTMRMSQLVGLSGRVIAVEPMPDTFALLAANTRLFEHANVSLLNIAASDRISTVGIDLPSFAQGLPNYYMARLTTDSAKLAVMTLPIDALVLPKKVSLVKIDVEGHEFPVLQGMRQLIERDHPVLIVETGAQETIDLLHSFGYVTERLPGSSNLLCRQRESANS